MRDLLEFALDEFGTTEVVGKNDNPEVLKYFHEIGHGWVKHDELAWCSAFINYCAKMTGYEYTGKLNARSWLDVGTKVNNPKRGDIIVFWRNGENSKYGHVGIFINKIDDNLYVLGGNQYNQVNIKPYPESRVLAYIRLNKRYEKGIE